MPIWFRTEKTPLMAETSGPSKSSLSGSMSRFVLMLLRIEVSATWDTSFRCLEAVLVQPALERVDERAVARGERPRHRSTEVLLQGPGGALAPVAVDLQA